MEAFHIFKVFVANPNKSDKVLEILVKNKGRLESFLTAFGDSNGEGEAVHDKGVHCTPQATNSLRRTGCTSLRRLGGCPTRCRERPAVG